MYNDYRGHAYILSAAEYMATKTKSARQSFSKRESAYPIEDLCKRESLPVIPMIELFSLGIPCIFLIVMDTPKGLLVTNYGEGGGVGYKTGRGAREVLPLRKGGGGKSFSHAEGGAHKVLG